MAKTPNSNLLVVGVIAVAAVYLVSQIKNALNSNVAKQAATTAYNAATGGLTDAQTQALVDQETQQLIHAGADPASAAVQAQSDVTKTLNSQPGYWQFLANEWGDLTGL